MTGKAETAIPSFLTTPPTAAVKPPLVPTTHELPFGQLAWEDFEKLCLRLVRFEADVEHCQLYGRRGQKQEGIDIFARRSKGQGYAVYQCKRVTDFGASDLREAITDFLGGAWAARASAFILCTEKSLNDRTIAEEFETQACLLKAKNITLLAWDEPELSQRLRNKPELVNDFFGKAWLEAFCGSEAASSLRQRLDTFEVAEFRLKLGQFYTHVFNTNDPGSESGSSGDIQLLPLRRRFILPDIEEEQVVASFGPIGRPGRVPDAREDLGSPSPHQDDTSSRAGASRRTIQRRIAVDAWLTLSERTIILGAPGGGKSTLLRFIVTDLLHQAPDLTSIAAKWGTHLPVWVPFATWTEKIRDHKECSLPELLQLHLKDWGEDRLWPLVHRALDDERLLLIVDGLDEWVDEGCAKRAVDKLQVFVAQRNLPAIVSSRPHGFAKLGWQQAGWRTATLAPLTRKQQKRFAHAWFLHRAVAMNQTEPQASATAVREADTFVEELSGNGNLRELAGIPLLLRIFIYFRFRNAALPQNRFDAYERMVNQLISEHPSSRQRAANITAEPGTDLDADEIRLILSLLAFAIQTDETGGVISKGGARTIIENYLKDGEHGPGMETAAAMRTAKRLLEIGQNTLGVLVERTPVEVGFFHRSFQEHLAANYVSRMPLDEQLVLIERVCASTQWSEVVMALCYLTRRPADVRSMVEKMRDRLGKASRADRYAIQRLLAEIAFGSLNCPTPLARELAETTFAEIELGDWEQQRIALTKYALGGLRSTPLRNIVRDRIKLWVPCYLRWRADLLRSLGEWQPSPTLLKCFWRNLHDEERLNRRAAARSLATRYGGDADVGNRVAERARHSVEPETRGAAIEALARGWPARADLDELLANAKASAEPELRLIAVLARVWLQKHTDDDADELLRLTTNVSASIFWREDIAAALVSGWPGSASIKKVCLDALRADVWRGRGHVDREIAEAVLITGYPQDDEVVERLIARASNRDNRSFLINHYHDTARVLAANFKRHPRLSRFLDQWLLDHPAETTHDVQDCMLAMTAGSDTAKAYLLRTLEVTRWIHWPAGALMSVWGMDDASVSASLTAIATGPAEKASWIGDLIPQIMPDPAEARSTLLRLLRDPSSRRIDFILTGLQAVGPEDGADEIVDIVVERLRTGQPSFRDDALPLLIGHYPRHPTARVMADAEVRKHGWWSSLAAAAYPNDAKFAPYIFRAASSLRVSLRQVIASDHSIGINDQPFALELFRTWNSEVDDEAKTETSISYHRLKVIGSGLDNADVTALREGIVAVGPDFEGRRQASLAGLIIADRLDLLNLPEADDKHAAFLIGFAFYRNVALVRTILHHWEFLGSKLGSKFWKILERFESDRLQLWSRFAPFLWEHEIPRGEALQFLSSRVERDSTPEILAFLANAATQRALLLEYLLAALSGFDSGGRQPLLALTAAELLAAEFGSEPELGKQLEISFEKERGDDWIEGQAGWTLIALCLGWPSSRVIHRLIAELHASGTKLPLTLPVWHLVCLESPSETVFENFRAILNSVEEPNEFWQPPMARALVGRLRRDDRLSGLMEERLYSSQKAIEKATIPRILGAARGLPDMVRSWAVREIDAQVLSPAGPEIAIDYTIGRMRPVVHTLLDALAL